MTYHGNVGRDIKTMIGEGTMITEGTKLVGGMG